MIIPTLRAAAAATAAAACCVCSVAAQAAVLPGQGTWARTLLARDLDGNLANGAEAFYDTVLNITWLADANAGAGTAYDTVITSTDEDAPSSTATDGRMVALDALLWAAQLEVHGVTGWRLPGLAPVDGIAFQYAPKLAANPYDGSIDEGYNLTGTSSELGHLFYTTLGMLGRFDSRGVAYGKDVVAARFNSGPFAQLSRTTYFAGERYFGPVLGGRPALWSLSLSTGLQTGVPDHEVLGAWAVHDGDVGHAMPVPEPQAWAQMLCGLAVGALLHRRSGRPRPRGAAPQSSSFDKSRTAPLSALVASSA